MVILIHTAVIATGVGFEEYAKFSKYLETWFEFGTYALPAGFIVLFFATPWVNKITGVNYE